MGILTETPLTLWSLALPKILRAWGWLKKIYLLRELVGLSPNSLLLIPGPVLKEGSLFGGWVPPTATCVVDPGH